MRAELEFSCSLLYRHLDIRDHLGDGALSLVERPKERQSLGIAER